MENGRESSVHGRPTRTRKSWFYPYGAIFAVLLFLGVLANPLAWLILPGLIPEIATLQEELSPDQTWNAVVRQEVKGFSDLSYTIFLRPGIGWIAWWRQEKVFELAGGSDVAVPRVEWTGPRELRVEEPSRLRWKPDLQRDSYRDVRVVYDLMYAPGHDQQR